MIFFCLKSGSDHFVEKAQKGYVFPFDKSKWKLSWPAEITADAAKKRNIDICQGTIQTIEETEAGVVLTLAVYQPGKIEFIKGLGPEELRKTTP